MTEEKNTEKSEKEITQTTSAAKVTDNAQSETLSAAKTADNAKSETSSAAKTADNAKSETSSATKTDDNTKSETVSAQKTNTPSLQKKASEKPVDGVADLMNDIAQKTVAKNTDMFDIYAMLVQPEKKSQTSSQPQSVASAVAKTESVANDKTPKADFQRGDTISFQTLRVPVFVGDEEKTASVKAVPSQKISDNPQTEPETQKGSIKGAFAKIFCGFVASAVIIGGAFLFMYKYNPSVIPVSAAVNIPGGQVKAPEEKVVFLQGIQIEGFDVGGKTIDEAKSLLAVRGPSLLPRVSLSVVYEGIEHRYENEDLEFSYNLNSVVDRAYEYSNYVIAEGSKDVLAYLPNDGNIEVDAENSTVNFRVEYKVTQESVRKVMKRLAKKVDIPCVEPHVSKFDTSKEKNSQRYTFAEGSKGKAIDQDTLITQAMERFNNGEQNVALAATSYESQPQLSMADVKQATKLIGKFSTISTNTYNANSNMATALASINGTILEPGEVLSFNDCTGNSNLMSLGYLPAGVISQGAMTTGIGGGICQAATTLYNAGIMANMEIVERQPHLWCSFYVYGGLDATIDWGAIDLKMKNTSKYQMFFRCWMDGVELNVEIYGWQSPEFDEIRTETDLDWSSYESYGYNAYRVFYKNGKRLKKEELPYSVYSLSNGAGIRGADYGDVSRKLTQPE